MSKRFLTALGIMLALSFVAITVNKWIQTEPSNASPMNVAELLGSGDDTAFEKVKPDYRLKFPRDHGAHPSFRNEWWYVTGNLFDQNHHRYGFQLTFFRYVLAPSHNTSGWQNNIITMAHFALSDHSSEQFVASEKFTRSGAGITGVQHSPFNVWLDDWQLGSTGREFFPLRLRAQNASTAIDLLLTESKGITLQGDNGYSQKSQNPSNASHYYSFTRLNTKGSLNLGKKTVAVTGSSWLDREWSTSALAKEQQGWDWFALQLNNGDDIMFYQLRHHDGSSSPYSSGIIVKKDEQHIALASEDIELIAQQHWTSPHGQRFPVKWRMKINHTDYPADLIIKSPVKTQFLDLSVQYWEGAIDVLDAQNQQALGLGFLEMTGY